MYTTFYYELESCGNNNPWAVVDQSIKRHDIVSMLLRGHGKDLLTIYHESNTSDGMPFVMVYERD